MPSPRAAGNMIAARVNQLLRSGEAKDVCAAIDEARAEAPDLAKIFDERLGPADDQAGSVARAEPPTLHTYSPAEAGLQLEKRMTELLAAGAAKTAREALDMAMQDLPQAARLYNDQ